MGFGGGGGGLGQHNTMERGKKRRKFFNAWLASKGSIALLKVSGLKGLSAALNRIEEKEKKKHVMSEGVIISLQRCRRHSVLHDTETGRHARS